MSGQFWFVVRRLLLTIPTLLVMSMVVFLIIRLVPGDPVRTMLGFRATDANVIELRHQLGLDQSLFVQYGTWLSRLLHGDLGTDIVSHAPLAELLAQRLPVTFELTGLSMLLAVAVGVPLGVWAATGGRWIKRLTEGFVVFGISIPDFWLGIMLVLLFTGVLMVLPPSGYVPFSKDPLGNLRYMTLPVLTLAIGEAAYILRTTRSAVAGVMDRPFVTFLRAKCRPVDCDRDRNSGRGLVGRRDHRRNPVCPARCRSFGGDGHQSAQLPHRSGWGAGHRHDLHPCLADHRSDRRLA